MKLLKGTLEELIWSYGYGDGYGNGHGFCYGDGSGDGCGHGYGLIAFYERYKQCESY